MTQPKWNGRKVRWASGEIESLIAVAKMKGRTSSQLMLAAHSVMGDALGSPDPLTYHKKMKAAQELMIKAHRAMIEQQELLDGAQAAARDILMIAAEGAKRGKYQTEES